MTKEDLMAEYSNAVCCGLARGPLHYWTGYAEGLRKGLLAGGVTEEELGRAEEEGRRMYSEILWQAWEAEAARREERLKKDIFFRAWCSLREWMRLLLP